jgi:diaminohydroxyphosphoribosylaminopyrimidine deaminase/5-amino-6-(5-phosphoribosylamino)uracil reductase
MRRAIALARAALGTTAPNPAVGCVIVAGDQIVGQGATAAGDQIVGQGATAAGGRPHAEERALGEAGDKARGATAFVTMEPCGARSCGAAPCADRLAIAGVVRVVFSAANPDPLSAGRGPARLRAGGVTVEGGFLAAETEALYADFIRAVRTDR